jgi:hypothetical protein
LVVPHLGDDYDSSEVDNGWWMAHETDFNLGYSRELMTDNGWYSGTDLGA